MTSPQLLINTTFAPAAEAIDDLLLWAHNIYIPAIEAAVGCSQPLLLRIAAEASAHNSTPTFAVQFKASSPEIAIDWLENRYGKLLASFFDGHTPEQLPYFTTVMEIL